MYGTSLVWRTAALVNVCDEKVVYWKTPERKRSWPICVLSWNLFGGIEGNHKEPND